MWEDNRLGKQTISSDQKKLWKDLKEIYTQNLMAKG